MKWLAVLFIALFLLAEATLVRAAEPTTNESNSVYGNGITIDATAPNVNHHPDLFWLTASWNSSENRWLVIYNTDLVQDGDDFIQGSILYCAVISSTSDAPIGTRSWHWTDSPLRLPYRASLINPKQGYVYATVSTTGCVTNNLGSTTVWITLAIGNF